MDISQIASLSTKAISEKLSVFDRTIENDLRN